MGCGRAASRAYAVPAGSRPTWVVTLPAGVYALVAGEPDGSNLAALGVVTTR
jgi:hypothetical protein